MEAFSLLKYWRAGGGGGAANMRTLRTPADPNVSTTTVAASALRPSAESDVDAGDDDDDESSFFDLEFTVQDGDDDGDENAGDDSTSESGGAGAGDQTSPSSSSGPSISLSSSGDLSVDPDPKSSSQTPASFLKSATRLRVFMLGSKKPKSTPNEAQGKRFSVKFKVEEVPIVSLFNRESSSKKSSKAARSEDEEKKFSKETVQKYISKIKPLYVRVSKRYGEKLKLADVSGRDEKVKSPAAGLRMVRKRLGKSKSASAVAAVSSPPVTMQQRRDDSLIQQQDGIDGAIAHCKRSLNGSSQAPLARSKSDQSDDRGAGVKGDR